MKVGRKNVAFAEFSREFRALQCRPPITMEMTPIEAWAVLSLLQLAWRHPAASGPTFEAGRAVALRLQEQVASSGALAEVARRGWFADFDS